jgi:hypothetical protein
MRPAALVAIFSLALGLVIGRPAAAAGLIGDDVLIEQNTTSSGTIRDDLVTVVAGSPELSCPGAFELCGANIPGSSHGNFDIEAHSLTLNVGPDGAPNFFITDTFVGYIFSDLDLPGGVTDAFIETDIAGLNDSRVVIFSPSSVGVNLSGLVVNPGEHFTVYLNQNPDLIGDDVLIEQNTTSSGTIRDDLVTVVAGSPELSCPGAFELCGANIPGSSHGNFDIEAHSLTLNVGPDGAPNFFITDTFVGYIFSDLDLPGGVTDAFIETDIAGLNDSRVIIFSPSSVGVNLSGLIVNPGEYFTVHLPEPGTFASLAAGGVAVAWLSRRRRRVGPVRSQS